MFYGWTTIQVLHEERVSENAKKQERKSLLVPAFKRRNGKNTPK